VYNEGSRNTLSQKQQLFKNISLSANTVAERVNDLAGDIQCELKEKCKNCMAYSIAMDESTDVKDIAQLAVLFKVLMRTLN
jgi:hypothetical protein